MSFRGPNPFAGDGFGTGGNVTTNAVTGRVPVGSNSSWHPTIVYLFVLLVLEWAGLVVLTKYI